MTTGANTPILHTKRLVLRAPDARDEPAMVRFFMSDFSRYWHGPFGAVEAFIRFAAMVGQWTLKGYGLMAITERTTGTTLGMAGPYHPEGFPEPEMSWLLCDAAHAGSGIAYEACEAVIAHEFTTRNWPSMVSFIHVDNAPSIALAQRLGAVPAATTASCVPNCVTYRHSALEVSG